MPWVPIGQAYVLSVFFIDNFYLNIIIKAVKCASFSKIDIKVAAKGISFTQIEGGDGKFAL